MLPTFPPLEAYRRDAARLAPGESFGPDDAHWLAASAVLERYVAASPAERSELAAELAAHLAGGDEVTAIGAGLMFAARIDKAGAIHLAASWIALLDRLVPEGRTLERGRVLAQRAQLLRKFGLLDDARGVYETIDAIGEATGEPELTARAWLGFAITAQMRGNYPEARRWYHAAALLADDNSCTEQAFNAHLGLLGVATVAGEFNRALSEGWRAFQICAGDPLLEAEVLTNMAQAMHGAGAHRAALRGFGAAVARSSQPDMLLAALGGAATAAAALGEIRVLDAVSARITRLANVAWTYPLALALLDLAEARERVGQPASAALDRERARRLAEAHGYHELAHRAQQPVLTDRPPSSPLRLDVETAEILEGIEQLDAPDDLSVAASRPS